MWVCECASVAQVCVEHLHAFTGTLFYLVVHVPRGTCSTWYRSGKGLKMTKSYM